MVQSTVKSVLSPAPSTTKTGCHGITEILLKVALKHKTSLYLISASVDPCTVKHAHAVTVMTSWYSLQSNLYYDVTFGTKNSVLKDRIPL
jgi:hypothetical protein